MSFNSDYEKRIDLSRACKDQYGPLAKPVLAYNHVWGWKCNNDGKELSIDLQLAADRQVGKDYSAFMKSLSSDGWVFMNLRSFNRKVVPVVLIDNDNIWKVDEVNLKLRNFKSHLIASQEWARQLVGKTFDLINPILFYCDISKEKMNEWNEKATRSDSSRYDYFYGYRDFVKNILGDQFNDKNIYVVAHVGKNNGSSALYPFAVVHSEIFDNYYSVFTEVKYTQRGDVADNIYALTHELFHAFGLDHCDDNNGIMLRGRPPHGSLSPDELKHLNSSSFFR